MNNKDGIILFCQHVYPAATKKICAANRKTIRVLKNFLVKRGEVLEEFLYSSFPMAALGLKTAAEALGTNPMSSKTNEAYWLCNVEDKKLQGITHNHLVFSIAKMVWDKLDLTAKRDELTKLDSCHIASGRINQIIKKPVPNHGQPGSAKVVYDSIVLTDTTADIIKTVGTFKFWERDLKDGFVSLHHGWICSSITKEQEEALDYYNATYLNWFRSA